MGALTLKWLLSCVASDIALGGSGGRFVVDLVPTLRYFHKLPGLTQHAAAVLRNFESQVSVRPEPQISIVSSASHIRDISYAQFPVSFALSLAVPADKLSKPRKQGGQMSQNGQNDEADATRTQASILYSAHYSGAHLQGARVKHQSAAES